MASRLGSLSYATEATFGRMRRSLTADALADWWRSIVDLLWPGDRSAVQQIIRLFWLPFWAFSDLPGPMPVHRARMAAPQTGIEQRLVALLRKVRRRQLIDRFTTYLFRGLALTCLIGAVWTTATLFGGSAIDATTLTAIGVAMIGLGLLYAWLYRPGLREIAIMLDATFGLDDRITTAVDEIGQPGTSGLRIAELQQIEATNTTAILMRRRVLRVHLPVREIVLATGLGLTLLALYLLQGTGGTVSALESGSVPAFVAAKDRLKVPDQPAPEPATNAGATSVQDVQDKAEASDAAEQDLLELADALDDNPITAPIADAIRAGDYDRAAAELNAIAPQLDQLSPDLQAQIAASLNRAADAMSGENPDLQDATRKAADDLASDEPAADSVSDLADEVEQTGEKVQSDDELAQEMSEAREAESDSGGSRDTRPEDASEQPSEGQGDQQIAGDGGDAATGSNASESGGEQQTTGSGGEGSQAGEDGQQGDQDGGQGEDNPSAGSTDATGGASSGESGGDQSSDPAAGGNGSATDAEAGQSGSSPDQPGDDGSNPSSDTGNGAGSGDSKNNTSTGDKNSGTGKTSGESDPDMPDPNVVDGGNTGTTATDETGGAPSETISLSRSPDAPGYRSGGSASSSSGSGTGAAAGPGSVEQGDVGEAGPDSNRVPDRYKDIVEDYFSDGP